VVAVRMAATARCDTIVNFFMVTPLASLDVGRGRAVTRTVGTRGGRTP
jgi:hypothetical protein